MLTTGSSMGWSYDGMIWMLPPCYLSTSERHVNRSRDAPKPITAHPVHRQPHSFYRSPIRSLNGDRQPIRGENGEPVKCQDYRYKASMETSYCVNYWFHTLRIMKTSEGINSLSSTGSIDTKYRILHAESVTIETGITLNVKHQTDDLSAWNSKVNFSKETPLQ